MDLFDLKPMFIFRTRELANQFCERMRHNAAKYDVVTVNDILKDQEKQAAKQGFKYGYSKAEIKKLKPVMEQGKWFVIFPKPGKMVRDKNGYWTTIPADEEADISHGQHRA